MNSLLIAGLAAALLGGVIAFVFLMLSISRKKKRKAELQAVAALKDRKITLIKRDQRPEAENPLSPVEPSSVVTHKQSAIMGIPSTISESLINTVRNGQFAMVKTLIERGVDVNSQNNNGKTALMWAAYHGNVEVIAALVNAGANANAQDKDGLTPMMYAAWRKGCAPGVKKLIELGADPNVADDQGQTSLMKAVWFGMNDIVQVLLDNGADVNAREKDGGTPLIWAAKQNQFDTVNILLARNANVADKDCLGMTALMHTTQHQNAGIEQLLKRAGATE